MKRLRKVQLAVVLVAGALLGACGGAASPPSTHGSQPAGWEATLAAAKQEGTVGVVSSSGEWARQYFDAFQAKYGISVNLLQVSSQAALVPKIDVERKAGIYSWDVAIQPPPNLYNGLKPLDALDPLRPALLLPEVLDDSHWAKGFDDGWSDADKAFVYSFVGQVNWAVRVNRSVVPESQLNRLEQLWEPQWKGKVAWQDPRQLVSGIGPAASIWKLKGEDKLRSILTDQQPGLTQDQRQLAEWTIRGQYPIAIGLNPATLASYRDKGVDISAVQPLKDSDPAASTRSSGGGSLSLFKRAPHLNAAKELLNWILSQEGQALFGKLTLSNSRRADVAAADADTVLDPKRDYFSTSAEWDYPAVVKAQALARDALK
jgi:ABC-type Fe3+ transport system substrate-binding protein